MTGFGRRVRGFLAGRASRIFLFQSPLRILMRE
jgi:hypothetical protein